MVTNICRVVVVCSGVCVGSAASVCQLELPRNIHIHSPISAVGLVGIQCRAAQLACGRSDGHAGRYVSGLLQQKLAGTETCIGVLAYTYKLCFMCEACCVMSLSCSACQLHHVAVEPTIC